MSNSRAPTTAGVMEKFGVRPEQIVDFLALIGDSVDNIPGVDKCGPKTAAKWLAEYGTLESVIANADDIGGKIGENLRAAHAAPAADRGSSPPSSLDVRGARRPPMNSGSASADREALRALYTRYEFNAALADLERRPRRGVGTRRKRPRRPRYATPPARVERHYELVTQHARFDATGSNACARADAIRLRHRNHRPRPACRRTWSACPSACDAGRRRPTCRWRTTTRACRRSCRASEVLEALAPLLEDPGKAKIGQHGKYDMHILRALRHRGRRAIATTPCSSPTCSIPPSPATTWIRWRSATSASRPSSTRTWPARAPSRSCSRRWSWSDAADYAAEDADVTLRLHRALHRASWPRSRALLRVYDEIEMPLVPVLARMEARRHPGRPRAAGARRARDAAHPHDRDHRARLPRRRPRLQPRFAQAAAAGAVRRARPAGQLQDPDRAALDQRGGAGGTGRPARAAAHDPRLPHLREAGLDLHREAARADQPAHRPRAHQLPPGGGGDRAPVLVGPEPAEHPDPHRGRPPHPPGLRRAARAGASSPPTTRRSSCASWPTCRRTRACCAPSARAWTCTAPPRPRCSA